jgi:hypothetical protein
MIGDKPAKVSLRKLKDECENEKRKNEVIKRAKGEAKRKRESRRRKKK